MINRTVTHIEAIFSAVIFFAILLAISFFPFALSSSITQYPHQYLSQNTNPYHYQSQQLTFIQQIVYQSAADPTPVQIQAIPYQNPSSPYQNPSSPYQNPSSPYQNPSSPYQNPSSPYQNPSSPYQNPSSPYQNPSSPYQNQQQTPSVTNNSSSTRFSNQQLPALIVVTHVNSTGGSAPNPANLSQVVTNLSQVVTNAYNNPDGYTYSYHFMRGSQMGVTLNLQPGVFAVYEPTNNILLSSHLYNTTYSGDCVNIKSTITSAAGTSNVYGYGTIKPGESKTCVVTNSFQKK